MIVKLKKFLFEDEKILLKGTKDLSWLFIMSLFWAVLVNDIVYNNGKESFSSFGIFFNFILFIIFILEYFQLFYKELYITDKKLILKSIYKGGWYFLPVSNIKTCISKGLRDGSLKIIVQKKMSSSIIIRGFSNRSEIRQVLNSLIYNPNDV